MASNSHIPSATQRAPGTLRWERGISPLSHCGGRGGQGGEGEPPAPLKTLRLLLLGAALVVILGGCATSPEASRLPGEPGADPGNHGDPVQLMAPADAFDRVYAGIPYEGPSVATEDTSQS
jgi:hypothetical protein